MSTVIENEITFLKRIQKEYHNDPETDNSTGDGISREIDQQIKMLNGILD